MIKVPYKLQVKFKLPPFIKWPYKNTKVSLKKRKIAEFQELKKFHFIIR